MSIAKIAELLSASQEEISGAILNLENILEGRGLVLVKKDNSVKLGISKDLGPIIEAIHKEEVTKELTKASLETIAIILYNNGVSRSEIDYIRGVNSSFIIRNLLIRGLIDKKTDPKDSRRLIYYPTFDALAFMGINKIEDLPNFENIKNQLNAVALEGESGEEQNG